MIYGIFAGNVPLIQVTLAWSNSIKHYWLTLDTGFTGDLQVPKSFAQELGLKADSIEKFTIANGQTVNVPQALAIASMEGESNPIQVGISNGSPLAGISFLTKFGYKAIFDTKLRLVYLKKV